MGGKLRTYRPQPMRYYAILSHNPPDSHCGLWGCSPILFGIRINGSDWELRSR